MEEYISIVANNFACHEKEEKLVKKQTKKKL